METSRAKTDADAGGGDSGRKRKDNEEPENPQAAKAARIVETPEDCKAKVLELVNKDLWSEDNNVVMNALGELGGLCSNKNKNADQNRITMFNAGAHSIIINKILQQKTPTVELKDLNCIACIALRNLLIGKVQHEKIISVGDVGGVEAIVAAMKSDPDNSYLQGCGCGALAILLQYCNKNAERLKKAGGIATIVKAMKTHPENAELQGYACRVIEYLCAWEQYKPIIRAAGAAGAIGAIIDNHGDDADVRKHTSRMFSLLTNDH